MICGAASLVIFALLFFAWLRESRRLVGVILVGVLTVTLLVPTASYAQFGILGGIQSLLNLIGRRARISPYKPGAASMAEPDRITLLDDYVNIQAGGAADEVDARSN